MLDDAEKLVTNAASLEAIARMRKVYTALTSYGYEKYVSFDNRMHCPVCGYVVDYKVPTQTYCDRCGQRLED